jgi:hypothetical protein
MRTARRIIGTALVMAALAVAFVVPASAATPERTYRVTIVGAPSQPVSAGLVFHRRPKGWHSADH